MKPLTQLAQDEIERHFHGRTGLRAIDATAGNGHDTVFLSRLVGVGGRVWAFDIQSAAIDQTRDRLEQVDPLLLERVELIHGSHGDLLRYVPAEQYRQQVDLIMFNLGYLPGGDKHVITQAEATLTALHSALELLVPGGLLSVIVYPGHPGGRAEADAVEEWFRRLPSEVFSTPVKSLPLPNASENGPRWLCVQRGGVSDEPII